jgi:hypothetical protein
MRLACPAHRSARPDCDLVAGGGSGLAECQRVRRRSHLGPAAQTLSSPSNGAYVTPAIFFVDWMRGSVLGSGRFSYARLFHWAT